ncbi:MAG: hypothetical protein GXY08_04945 [Ruminococcus sp.]|nr:hypothetical protein [Ruminococcus sp.]
MDSIDIPNSLLPKGIKAPRAFIADKKPELPDYGVDTGDLVIVDSSADFVNGELSAFQSINDSEYRLSRERLKEYRYFGKVITVLKYYVESPII